MRKLENVLKSVKNNSRVFFTGAILTVVGILGPTHSAMAGLTYDPAGTTTVTVSSAAEGITMSVTFSNNAIDLLPSYSNIGMYQPADISYTLTTSSGTVTGTDCTIYVSDNYKSSSITQDYILFDTGSSLDIQLSTTDLAFYSGISLENLYLTDSSLVTWGSGTYKANFSGGGLGTVYIDNVSIDNNAPTVPAPGALALTGLGGLIASRRRAMRK